MTEMYCSGNVSGNMLVPKTEEAEVRGKELTHISVKQTHQLRTEFFDEEDYLITTLQASEIKNLGGQELPSKLTIIPAGQEGFYTEMTYKELDFNPTFPTGFFERRNIKLVQ